jgi:hypothetical protein
METRARKSNKLLSAFSRRQRTSEFITSEINPYIEKSFYNQDILKGTDKSLCFIFGSKAWNCEIKSIGTNLNEKETVSILPKNYDIMCICNDGRRADDMYLYFQEKVEEIKKQLKRAFKGVNFDTETNYEIKEQDLENNEIIRKYIPSFSQKLYEDCWLLPNCRSINIIMNSNEFKDEAVLFIQVIESEDKNIIEMFSNNLLNKNCELINNLYTLNIKGLFLFLELIEVKREKEFDVDETRREIVMKVIGNNKKEIYNYIIEVYRSFFNDRIDFETKYNYLLKKYQEI